jgi:LysM repeat protein
MRRLLITIMVGLVAVAASAQSPIEKYIAQWAPTAVREMYRSGVPASITLAQGILESRYGLSTLAADGNNHFGIKCHKDWTGKKQYHDDDAKGECFRVYDTADESFRDHSDFLRYRDRYKFLFDLETTDYKSWAYGLKKAGYATDPGYPGKLIKYIEDYKLYEYDTMPLDQTSVLEEKAEAIEKKDVKKDVKVKEQPSKEKAKTQKKSVKESKRKKAKKKSSADDELTGQIPQSPLSLEEPKRIDKSQLEEFKFSLTREAYSKNGVPFVTSVEGETYSTIAARYGLFLKEILKYNDLTAPQELLPGTVVYLQAKKNQSEKGLDKFIVEDDSQSLRDICQRFGVKMSSVVKMNGFAPGYQPSEGDTILLRGKRRNKR